jgi:ppGpp synthetase/RelA/SpoT-type nucleotidyltranferase
VSNYEKLQEEYAAVYPAYERLAEFLQRLLRKRLDEGGHRLTEVFSRAKDPASFVKKAMRKGYLDPMASIGDKAGARIVIPFSRDRASIQTICGEVLELSAPDDKREELGLKELGYLGLHFKATIKPDVLGSAEADLAGLEAELQIHTKVESAWATASHDSLYKAAVPVPDAVGRRIMRLAALAEIFDDEVERFLVELAEQPNFAELQLLLPVLDGLLLRYTPRAGDQGTSALLIPVLSSLYGCETAEIISGHVRPYLAKHDAELRALYDRHDGDTRANPLLYQPEVFMLLERLANDPYRLQETWPAEIDVSLLTRLAALRGTRLK